MQRLYQGSENTIQFSYGGCISLRSISLITVQAGYIMTNFVQIPTISALYPQYQSPFVNSRLICLLALFLVHWRQIVLHWNVLQRGGILGNYSEHQCCGHRACTENSTQDCNRRIYRGHPESGGHQQCPPIPWWYTLRLQLFGQYFIDGTSECLLFTDF